MNLVQQPINRPCQLDAQLAAFGPLPFLLLIASVASAAERINLEVREPHGLMRRGYPAHTLLTLPQALPINTPFRLLYDGQPVVAQFRADRAETTAKWWLDFQVELAPHQTKTFQIEYGGDTVASPERTQGHQLTRTDKGFAITNAPYITWSIASDLKAFIQSVNFMPSEFLRPDSPGLLMRDRQSREHSLTGNAEVIRQGMMTVALRFENTETDLDLAGVRSTVDLTFPGPVSWVELQWAVDDPQDKISALGMQLNLNLDKPSPDPTLVDFGASSMVYVSLYPGQEAELVAGSMTKTGNTTPQPDWQILRGEKGRLSPFAANSKSIAEGSIEGWCHIMDRKKCLALAVHSFARDTVDRIGTGADGRVTVWREFSPGQSAKQKQLRLWLHFVHFPPQASAGASPQQMQWPLDVKVSKP